MNWLRKVPIFNLLIGILALGLSACGVKGDPLPPEKPAELGRGRPTYRRATEGIAIEKRKRTTAPTKTGKADEDSESDERNEE